MENQKTLLVIVPNSKTYRDSVFKLLVAETGEALCSHLCSNSGFAPNDLYEGRPERIEDFRERFGEVEIKFIDETDLTEDELVKRNHKWYEEKQKNIKL